MLRFVIYLLSLVFWISCNSNEQVIAVSDTDFCSTIHRNNKISLSDELSDIDHLMKKKTGVYVLEDGSGSMVARAWLSEYAENTIDIQYFIFSTDNIGLIACDYLVRAADRGVKVRIIVDDIMVEAPLEDVLTLDAHPNISLKIYNPGVNLGKSIYGKIKKFATDFRSANQRMHNKTFIVDDKIVITGGRNIADEYFDFDHEYNFRDRDVLLLGKEVNNVKKSFTEFWESPLSVKASNLAKNDFFTVKNDKNTFNKLHEYACNPDNFWPHVRSKIDNFSTTLDSIKSSKALVWVDKIQFISDKPGKNDGKSGLGGGSITTDELVDLVKKAKSSIDIQTPYLITTKESRQLFQNAINRGVKIRILTNSLASTDNLEAFSSYQSSRKKLLETGVHIYEFRPDAAERTRIMTSELQKKLNFKPIFGLHAKTMVIDQETTIIGTFNLDPRSANLNTECIVIMESLQISKSVLQGIEQEFKPENSWKITNRFNPDSKVGKVKRIKTWTRKIIPVSIL